MGLKNHSGKHAKHLSLCVNDCHLTDVELGETPVKQVPIWSVGGSFVTRPTVVTHFLQAETSVFERFDSF